LDSGEKGYDEKEKRQRKKIEKKNESDWLVLQKKSGLSHPQEDIKKNPGHIKRRKNAEFLFVRYKTVAIFCSGSLTDNREGR
jgi:hypothetical protein